jgi:hypothetical protein
MKKNYIAYFNTFLEHNLKKSALLKSLCRPFVRLSQILNISLLINSGQ